MTDHIAAARRAVQTAIEALDAHVAAQAPAPAPAAPAPSPVPDAAIGLSNPAEFFNVLRASSVLGPTLTKAEVDGASAILAACAGVMPLPWAAYALGTAFLETAGTMQPISEYGGPAYFKKQYDIEGARPAKARELGNLHPGDGVKFHGRGYVQLTGRSNYKRAGVALGHPIESDPELAKRPDIAAAIMVRGMTEGWFTGKSLRDYLPAEAGRGHYVNARRVINSQDRAGDIADYALVFAKALKAGGWK